MNLHLRLQELSGSPLARAYLSGSPAALRFFAGDPLDLAAFRRHAATLRARFGPDERRQVAAALKPTSERASRRLNHFVEHGGAVVTTGQQTGLFTGPLYTVHKILTTVRLAEALEAELDFTVLPVFWAASEDHDWAEVNHAHWLDQDDRLLRVELAATDTRPLPMAERRVEASIEEALDAAAQVLTETADGAELLEVLREAYRPGVTVAGAFREVVEELFSPFDLLLTDAADAALKEASRPVLARELASAERHEAVLRANAQALVEGGYRPQVPILDSGSNLFFRTALGRERLYRVRGGWVSHDSGSRYRESELEPVLEREPGRFSPNVLLRPVVESAVFPVLAYVAGPGELSYWAQLKPLFESHSVPMPLVFPRASFVLMEQRIERYLERLNLELEDLKAPRHELIIRHSRAHVPPEITSALRDLREAIVTGFDQVGALSAEFLDPTLRGAAEARRNRALIAVSEAERKIVRAVRHSEAEAIRFLDAALNHLVPLRSEQERVLNVVPILARHGRGLLHALAAHIPIRWHEPDAAVRMPAEVGEKGATPAAE